MEAAGILLTILLYGCASYLLWQWQNPLFLFAFLGGHIGALISPLWPILYGYTYASELTTLLSLSTIRLLQPVVIVSAWFYTLPPLIVIVLYRLQLWFSGYVVALTTFAAFLLYHLVFELLGLSQGVWSYGKAQALSFGISNWMMSALFAALISFGLLYSLLMVVRFSWLSQLMLFLPAPLMLIIVVRGLLGAPIWISQLLKAQSWVGTIGVVCTLALMAWAVHIIAMGISRLTQEVVV